MTDEEKKRAVAERVMGWTEPPDDKQCCRYCEHFQEDQQLWTSTDGICQDRSDERAWWAKQESANNRVRSGYYAGHHHCDAFKWEGVVLNFDPLTNPAHWMLVVERMLSSEIPWYITITGDKHSWTVSFGRYDKTASSIHKKLGHAVCEAALKAVG